MKFSVIIPVYNVENYLKDCVESILNQSNRDFEVILVDDGSTDQSGILCDFYAREYPEYIKVFHRRNSGILRSRIFGLNQSVGDICVFVDSDDALRQDALEKIDAVFQETECDLVIYGASKDADFVRDALVLPFSNQQCFEGMEKKTLYALMTESEILNSVWTKAARKEVYDRVLADYNTDLDISFGEDLYLSLPLMTNAKKITYLKENLYFYRVREGSAVHSFCPQMHRSVKIVKLKQEQYLERWGMQELSPVFYSGVVYKWMAAAKGLLENQSKMNRKEVEAILLEMSEDAFFRKAYRNRIPGRLSQRDRLLARWLYHRKVKWVRLIGNSYFCLKAKFQMKKQGS